MKVKASEIKKAIRLINQHDALLVFTIKNEKFPKSIWGEFYPRTEMKWEWNEDGDDRVMRLWMLMKELSRNKEVIYTKWYKGRATFLSQKLFSAFLRLSREAELKLSSQARNILEFLEMDSPLSTKQIKQMTELQGKDNQKFYDRAMKQLFQSFLIIGFGEVEDGAFPSLAVAATRTLHEELWIQAQNMTLEEAQKIVLQSLASQPQFINFLNRSLKHT